jgi:WD40 repeat protein
VAFTPDGQALVSALDNGTIRVWDIVSRQVRAEYNWKIGAVRSVVLAPDGMTAAAGGSDHSVLVWDFE